MELGNCPKNMVPDFEIREMDVENIHPYYKYNDPQQDT
jgi:hypothetical protein